MGQNNKDVVYILKSDIQPNELKYSLRSLKNFPHNKVWFFCGCPFGIKPDVYVPFTQEGKTKWEKATSTYRVIANSDVSNDFWLFNDDFYILEEIETLPMMYRGTLKERVEELQSKCGSSYCKKLDEARAELESKGYNSLDYALHVPMLINKQKALEVLNTFKSPMFRSLYGNYVNAGGVKTEDVKIYNGWSLPEKGQTLLSTSDVSFKIGAVGNYIRDRFPEPSRWEVIK